MLCAGRRIPARNASVEGTCLSWLGDPGWACGRIQGSVLAPLTFKGGQNLPELIVAALHSSRHCSMELIPNVTAPHSGNFWDCFTLLWKITLLGVLTWAPASLWLGWRAHGAAWWGQVQPLCCFWVTLCFPWVLQSYWFMESQIHCISKFGNDLQDHQVQPLTESCRSHGEVSHLLIFWTLTEMVTALPCGGTLLPVLSLKGFFLDITPDFRFLKNKSSGGNHQTLPAGMRCQLWNVPWLCPSGSSSTHWEIKTLN